MNPSTKAEFDQRYQTHLKHLKLKGLQPKTIDAYSRPIRRMGDYFDYATDNLSPAQLTNYFSDLIETHSWSAVKLDLYGFKFYTLHVLGKPWVMPNFIKLPKVSRLPDIDSDPGWANRSQRNALVCRPSPKQASPRRNSISKSFVSRREAAGSANARQGEATTTRMI
jgi:hypothetical protein